MAVEEGVAIPDAVDIALRLGAGHPEGPFERMARIAGSP
jgi:3-hydroxyacyl-CoA dehydrogenase